MRFLLLTLSVLLFATSAYARCNANYADHLLNQRYQNCSGTSFFEDVKSIDGYYNAVAGVCADGCYSAMFNQALIPECDRKYLNAIADFSSQISNKAAQNGCTDTGPVSINEAQPSRSIDDNCTWLARTSVELKCGGGAIGQNVCGVGGKMICTGEIVCASESDFSGAKLPAGVHGLSCLSTGSDCSQVAISTCASDVHTNQPFDTTFYNRSLAPTVDRVRSEAVR